MSLRLLRGVSVLINRGQGSVGRGRGPVKLIQKAELGGKKDQVEAISKPRVYPCKLFPYSTYLPLYHLPLPPFILTYTTTFPNKNGVRLETFAVLLLRRAEH